MKSFIACGRRYSVLQDANNNRDRQTSVKRDQANSMMNDQNRAKQCKNHTSIQQ